MGYPYLVWSAMGDAKYCERDDVVGIAAVGEDGTRLGILLISTYAGTMERETCDLLKGWR